ncbi:hypothetical protein HMPREF9389_0462 [Streptococcus sanguinis SK355]|uniref:Uncharacterized protein n=1 Tax=Streptococcus sanguinis SK355 TaxID=888816 RepID=F3UNQ4_STRSA|nr:hypothetical protein HMPREF9389_0462 [Streptococcus sanguinis SK355]
MEIAEQIKDSKNIEFSSTRRKTSLFHYTIREKWSRGKKNHLNINSGG